MGWTRRRSSAGRQPKRKASAGKSKGDDKEGCEDLKENEKDDALVAQPIVEKEVTGLEQLEEKVERQENGHPDAQRLDKVAAVRKLSKIDTFIEAEGLDPDEIDAASASPRPPPRPEKIPKNLYEAQEDLPPQESSSSLFTDEKAEDEMRPRMMRHFTSKANDRAELFRYRNAVDVDEVLASSAEIFGAGSKPDLSESVSGSLADGESSAMKDANFAKIVDEFMRPLVGTKRTTNGGVPLKKKAKPSAPPGGSNGMPMSADRSENVDIGASTVSRATDDEMMDPLFTHNKMFGRGRRRPPARAPREIEEKATGALRAIDEALSTYKAAPPDPQGYVPGETPARTLRGPSEPSDSDEFYSNSD